jgi:excisionase family DNA binding protein
MIEGCKLGNDTIFGGDDEGAPVGSKAKLPQLFTLAEVARALALSPHTVRAFVRKGKLHPIRICRRLLFHPDELKEFINAGR